MTRVARGGRNLVVIPIQSSQGYEIDSKWKVVKSLKLDVKDMEYVFLMK